MLGNVPRNQNGYLLQKWKKNCFVFWSGIIQRWIFNDNVSEELQLNLSHVFFFFQTVPNPVLSFGQKKCPSPNMILSAFTTRFLYILNIIKYIFLIWSITDVLNYFNCNVVKSNYWLSPRKRNPITHQKPIVLCWKCPKAFF